MQQQSALVETSGLYAVVLAAGCARRFGGPKLLAELDGEPLVRRALRAAEAVCASRAILVVGSHWQEVSAACAPLAGFLVRNERFDAGMAASIVAAVGTLPTTARAVLLTLADQPLVDAQVLRKLIRFWLVHPERIAYSGHDAYSGPPAIFPRTCFAELAALEGDRGARPLIERHSETARMMDCRAAAFDVDTPGDLAGLQLTNDRGPGA